MALPLPPAARERRRAATRLLEHALLLLVLWRLASALGTLVAGILAPASVRPGPPPRLRVDLARDPPSRLRWLPGVGPSRAEAILRDRREHGPPHALADLARVHGIGPVRLDAVRGARDVEVWLDGAPLPGPSPPG